MQSLQKCRKHCGNFFSRIAQDFKQKQLLPLKLLFFVNSSTLFVLYPYLTIHMRELGINVEETAIMSAVTPIVAIIMPPLAGMVADKIGNFKLLLCIFSTGGGLAALLLLLVPVGRITVTYPDEVLMSLGCSGVNATDLRYSPLDLTLSEDFPCNRSHRFFEEEVVLSTRMESCGFMCMSAETSKQKEEMPQMFQPLSSEEDEDELSIDSVLKARSYVIKVTNSETKVTTYTAYNLTAEDMPSKPSKQEALSERFIRYNPNFRTAIRRFSSNLYFLPTGKLYAMSCSQEDEEMAHSSDFLLSASRFSRGKRDVRNPYSCRLTNSNAELPDDSSLKPRLKNSKSNTFQTISMFWNDTEMVPTCEVDDTDILEATVHLHNPDNNLEVLHEIKLENCQPRCLLIANRTDTCFNTKKEIEYNPNLTFWSYMAIRVFIGVIGGTAFAMFEGAVIAILREQKADYGLQRIYAAIGGMISSPVSGALIDYVSEGKGYTDFRPAFYLYAGLKILGGALMLSINLEFKTASENVVKDVMKVLKKVEVIGLLVACFMLGTAWGYIESFLFWLLADLGGTKSLMGITITVGGIAGIPLLALSGPIIEKIGHANVIFIGFIFYAIRLLGYSLIYNPWHCLFFEAMESITSALSFTAAVTYAAKLSTSTTDSSIQGLLGGLYFGVGKGAGSLVGGYLMKAFGTRQTFQVFGVFTAFMGCIYFFFNKFYISKLPPTEGNDIVKKEPKDKMKYLKPSEVFIGNGEIANNNAEKKEEAAHDNPAFTNDEETMEDKEKEQNGGWGLHHRNSLATQTESNKEEQAEEKRQGENGPPSADAAQNRS